MLLKLKKKNNIKMENLKLFEEFINELSSDIINKTADVMKSKGQYNRADELIKKMYDKFINNELCGGEIINISKKTSKIFKNEYLEIVVSFDRKWFNNGKDYYIKYDINKDKLDLPNKYGVKISRKDVRLLSNIIVLINPNTQYKNGTGDIKITDY
jgi:hypothetical protein